MAAFDPFSQEFNLTTGDGNSFTVSIPNLDDFVQYNNQICITYGTQIGASIVLLLVLLLVTKPDKRSSVIFIVNALSLALNIIRNVLLSLYFTGPFTEAYAFFSSDFSRVTPGAYATSITSTIFALLVLVCAEISLCIQVNVVCVTLREVHRRVILASCILVALIAIGFRLALCIENSKAIYDLTPDSRLDWLANITNITTTISVFWFSAVFVTKLGFALYQRRKLGLVRFGPMQIIFIMGCQTLVIPAIFSLVSYFVPNPALSSNTITAVVIFLPLSSLWASASIDSRLEASKEESLRRKMGGSYVSTSSGPMAFRKNVNGPPSPSNTATTRGSNPPSPQDVGQTGVYQDLEAQGMTGIQGFGTKE